jgi:hypothetical protein
MSLKPPSLWIEQRGLQHRVYWRNSVPGLRARPYLPFYVRAEAERFTVMAGLLGLDTARQVATTEDPQAAAALLQAALTERGLAPADPAPRLEPLPPAPAGPPPLFTAPADPRLTGVTFEELWTRFRTPRSCEHQSGRGSVGQSRRGRQGSTRRPCCPPGAARAGDGLAGQPGAQDCPTTIPGRPEAPWPAHLPAPDPGPAPLVGVQRVTGPCGKP